MGPSIIIKVPKALHLMLADLRGKKVIVSIDEFDADDYNKLPDVREHSGFVAGSNLANVGGPFGSEPKTAVFMKIFERLSGPDRNDVEEKSFINELVKTQMFTENQTRHAIQKALQDGQIYERRAGYLVKA